MGSNVTFLNLDRAELRESCVAPFVTALLAVPLVSHPRRDVCPGDPLRIASLPGNHRSYDRGQFLDFLGRPGAWMYINIDRCPLMMHKVHLSAAQCDVRDGFGSGPGS